MKRGFTLVEIIISIGLIVVIGIVSIFSFNLIKENKKEKTLNNMSDEILNALRLYIETNDEAKSKIYNNYEGMAITLNTLESEGLIDFQDIDVSDKKDYVVAMLSQESGCSDITTVKSWDLNNGPLYICSKGGSQNLFSVGGDATNLSQSTREAYYFKGTNPQNYAQLNGTGAKYRIISVEKDDSIILYHTTTFGTVFNGLTQAISYTSNYTLSMSLSCINEKLSIGMTNATDETGAEKQVDLNDLAKVSTCSYKSVTYYLGGELINEMEIIENQSWFGGVVYSTWANSSISPQSTGYYLNFQRINYSISAGTGYKIHLKDCVKITGGTGDHATPYKLTSIC